MNSNKNNSKKEKFWETERRAASYHQQKLNQHDNKMALMQSEIEKERARTKQLQQEKLEREQLQKAIDQSKNIYGGVTTKPLLCNITAAGAVTTSFPSSSSSSSWKPTNFSSTSTYSSREYDGPFKQSSRSVSTPPPPPPRTLQSSETQTMSVPTNSIETQTFDNYYSYQTETKPSYNFTEKQGERKPIKFPPRLKPPLLDLYEAPNSSQSYQPIKIASSSPPTTNPTEKNDESVKDNFELIKQQLQEEANERRRKEEEQLKALKMAVQYNPVTLPTSKFALKSSHGIKLPSSSFRRNSVPEMIHNQMTSAIKHVRHEDVKVDTTGIGIIGLPKTGRNFLIGALAGGIWPKDLGAENPIKTKNGAIYKLNHPNNGFINGSINENRPIYEQFFQNSKLSKLSLLILTIDGAIREEDYLILLLANDYSIPTVIVRTKLDEWLDNLPKGQTKEEYVENDKQFMLNSLKELNFPFSKNHIFNVSALAMITIAEEGPTSSMVKYKQDEMALLSCVKEHPIEDNKQPKPVNVDIAILGLRGSGKSAVVEGLKRRSNLPDKFFNEMDYDETININELIHRINQIHAKIYIVVIPNTVGRLDAEITKYLLDLKKNVCVVLNKSDEMIDNLKKQHNFFGNDDYIRKRQESARHEFVKVNINPEILPCFSVSVFVLAGNLDNTYVTQEQSFLNYVSNVLNSQV